ncbi:MAG TPA: NTP transferase domain-containing protein, partial [Candidatus Sulfotelmatobacter sp.]|nr:NTP transferase domain-containing protein [Candidatus Sulfotelmatobacter sp.]
MDGSPRAVILAAGQGKRMRSSVPKVLHRIAGRSLLLHVVDTALQATGRRPIVVINPAHPQVREALGDAADIVVQAQPRGTADALRSIPPDQRSPGPVIV